MIIPVKIFISDKKAYVDIPQSLVRPQYHMTPCSVSLLIYMLKKYLMSACYICSRHDLGCWGYRSEQNRPKKSGFCGASIREIRKQDKCSGEKNE